MESKDLLFPLIGALWACANLIIAVTVEANKIRDRVIIGRDGEHALDPEFRKHLMCNDWLPYSGFIAVASLGFGALAVVSPYLLSESAQRASARPIALFVGVASFLMGACWIPASYGDWNAMKRAIASATNERSA
jgi:SNF family Na+-dependent transporter